MNRIIPKLQKIPLWVSVSLLLLTFLYFGVKIQWPMFVEKLYTEGQFEILNKMARSLEQHGLDYYLGRTQMLTWGPLLELISGLTFVFFALIFLKEAKRWEFALAVLVYLVVVKWEVLFFPLYGDAIGGPFAEALWLAQHNFDYVGLFHQPGYAAGGPKVYFFTIYPMYLAMLMKIFPWPKVFLFMAHGMAFGFAAVLITFLRDLIRKISTAEDAILLSLAVLFVPIVQSQVEAVNMEVPCLIFAFLSVYFLIEKRIYLAGWMAILSMCVKGIGVFAGAGFFVVVAFWFFQDRELRFNFKILAWAVVVIGFSALALWFKYLINDQHVSIGGVNFFKGWESLHQFDIAILFYLAGGSFLLGTLGVVLMRPPRFRESYFALLIMFIFVCMWFMLFLNFYSISPRYRVAVYPFVACCVFFTLNLLIPWARLRQGVIGAAIVWLLLHSYGYPTNLGDERNHVLLERSLEYRIDLKLNQKLAKMIEDRYSEFMIGAPFTLAQMLAIPEAGYVHKKLDVMIYGFSCTYADIKNFTGLEKSKIEKTMFVTKRDERIQESFPYPINDQDLVVAELEYGHQKAWLFMGGYAIDRMWKALQLLRFKRGRTSTGAY